jgi:uncharacterized membrane protein
MNQTQEFLTAHWFSLVLLAGALALGGAVLVLRRRRKVWSMPLLLAGAAVALMGAGGLASGFESTVDIGGWTFSLQWTLGLGLAALAVFFGMLLVVIITGAWSAPLGYGVGALLIFGLGGTCADLLGQGLTETGKLLASLEATQPWWLVLLGFIPVIFYLSYRSLAGLGPVRRWMAIGLRSALILFLTLALAEVRIRHQNENITVLFLVDRSLSIPQEYDPADDPESPRVDRREERIERFINDVVQFRGPEHKYDRAGLILFGRRPRLEFPPSSAPSFNFRFRDASSNIDGNYTDIAAALKLALASFPEGTGKRIVLLSDGNENLGNALEQARIAKQNGAQIDVVPLASAYRNENEVLVERVEAPPKTEMGSRVPIRVLLRSYHPRTVFGTLKLDQITDGVRVPVRPSPRPVQLHPGLNAITFQQPLTNQQQSYTYEAIFLPQGFVNEQGQQVRGLAGDRVENNRATTHVVAMGQRRILLVEPKKGDHSLLVDRLKAVGNNKYKVHAITVDQLPQDKADLALFLSDYDCFILANVAASDVEEGVVGDERQLGVITEEQQEIIRSNTHDQGCGLIMIGGPNGFGAGGWQNTPVEKALPVDCDIKSFKVTGKGGLAMIMHACEMSQGNFWEQKIASLAVKKLSPADELGVLHYEIGQHKWHIPLQVIGSKKNAMLGMIDRMTPGDMPDFDGPFKMAYDSLTEPKRQLATKHVIVITDGDPQLTNRGILSKMKKDKVTVTTVGVATHGVNEDTKLKDIATTTGGRFYKVTNAKALPAIYVKETRLISQSWIDDRRFVPRLMFKSGPTEKLPNDLASLYGYVRTTPKQSPLVEMPILGPPQPDMDMPILAYWHYGLGKSVAFTSDARSVPGGRQGWDREWAGSDMYSKFWEQVVDWALRPTESGQMVMTTDYSDGKVRVTVDARDKNNRPLSNLILRGGVTSPASKGDDPHKLSLKFEQKNSGLYEAEFKAPEAGSYIVDAQAVQKKTILNKDKKEVDVEEGIDSVRAGVTIPYSPEFADMESNTALMEKLRDITGGETILEEKLAQAVTSKETASGLAKDVFRSGLPQFKNLQPIWYWLVFFTAIGLFFDVAVRRIAIQPAEAATAATRLWERLRGRTAVKEETLQFMDRLQSRKAQVSETLDQLRAARRFEPGEVTAAAPRGADEATAAPAGPPASRPAPKPKLGPEAQQEATDAMSRLMKAKQRVWQEREKDKQQ